MGKIIIPEIRDNYTLYSDLLIFPKSIAEKIIDISTRKPNNKHFITTDNITVKHSTLPHEIVFTSEVKTINYKFFMFKVRCLELSEVPFFRFDSDGPPHRNYDESIPLNKQQITTPHFHNFNIAGVSMAYKTNELLKEATRKALEDINLCIVHFFSEANIRVGADDFPTVSILSKTLQIPQIQEDPNSGVAFL